MAKSSIKYAGSGTNALNATADPYVPRGPSYVLFDPFEDESDPTLTVSLFTDFVSKSGLVATNVGQYAFDGASATSFEDSSTTLLGGTGVGGTIVTSLDATDNHEIGLEFGDGHVGPYAFNLTGANASRIAFETSVSFAQIVTQDFFCGLAVPGYAADTALISDSDTFVTTAQFVGFWILAAASSTLKCGYQAASQTTQAKTAATIVAATTYKLGFSFTPTGGLTFYVNQVPVGSVQTPTFAAGLLSAATFPSNVAMVPLITSKTSTTATVVNTYDFLKCCQKSPY